MARCTEKELSLLNEENTISAYRNGSSDDDIDSSEQKNGHKKGSCFNCSRKLRAHRFCKLSFSQFYISIVSTAVIQFLILCIFIFDPEIGVYVPKERLPSLNDCGDVKLKPTIPIFIVLSLLNFVQIAVDLWSTAVTFLYARQMGFGMVILRYIFTTLVRARTHLVIFNIFSSL